MDPKKENKTYLLSKMPLYVLGSRKKKKGVRMNEGFEPDPESDIIRALNYEQTRDENGKAYVTYIVDGAVRSEEVNKFECDRCGAIRVHEIDKPIFCPDCEKKSKFNRITPAEIKELWMPYRIEIYDPPNPRSHPLDNLPIEINSFISDHLCLRNYTEIEVLTRWIMASYRQDDFSSAPYLQFIGPVESGKTRALEVIRLLAYRGILHAFITPSALCRELTLYHPTICIDQAEQIFNISSDRGAEMYNIFMSGYRSDQKYVVASSESDEGLVLRDVFGFKAISSTRVFDEALASRSIIFKMQEGTPKIKEIGEESLDRARHIRNKLLYLRLLRQELPPAGHDEITGRLKEIFTPLLRVRDMVGWEDDDLIAYIRADEIEKEKEMADTYEAELLRKIKSLWESTSGEGYYDAPTRILIKNLSEDPKDRVKIGYKLKAMNIERKHSKEGQYIDLEDPVTVKQLKYLFRHFHIIEDEEEEE